MTEPTDRGAVRLTAPAPRAGLCAATHLPAASPSRRAEDRGARMQKAVSRTGDHGIGLMIHVVHMTDDVPKLTAFYEEVFLGYTFLGQDEPNSLPIEDRWATLIMIGDYCVETMAPKQPVNARLPVGKFYSKYGRHLHSVGYKVDDLEGLGDRLIEDGVHLGKPGGGRIQKMDRETVYFYP